MRQNSEVLRVQSESPSGHVHPRLSGDSLPCWRGRLGLHGAEFFIVGIEHEPLGSDLQNALCSKTPLLFRSS
jgi:hypothetical protein